MHDIGKLLLGRHVGQEKVDEIRNTVHQENLTFIEGEQKLLGTDHAEVGGAIARHWSLPEPLVAAIELHHNPDQQPDALLDIKDVVRGSDIRQLSRQAIELFQELDIADVGQMLEKINTNTG